MMKARRFAGVLLVLICLFGAAAQAAVKTNFSVSTEEKLETAFKYVKKHGVTEFTVTMDAALYKKMTKDGEYALQRELMLCGAWTPGKYTLDDEARKVSFSVRWSSDPVYQVTSKAELDSAIGKIVKKNATRFVLVMSKTLYGSMSGDRFALFKQLLGRHCIRGAEYTAYDDLHVLKVTLCSIMRNAKYVTTMDEAVSYIRSMADKEAESMYLFCSATLYKKLCEEITWDGVARTRHQSLLKVNGGFDFNNSHDDVYRCIAYTYIDYYPGFRIVNAVEKGNEKQLSDTDKATLEAARKLVKNLNTSKYRTGTADSKKAAAIVEALARLTAYRSVPLIFNRNDDCAYGPLLDGEADCDGYADAFYLCASLAGLSVRYANGPEHMWNMVKTQGKWYFVDATWCDAGEQADFRYFMLGKDRASQTYVYFTDLMPALAAKTDPKLIP